jgi:hypothetical protein
MQSGLQASAGAERIPAANNGQSHIFPRRQGL